MATLVITTERAALFADSRYWVQAEAELRRQRHRSGEDSDRRGHPPHRLAGHECAARCGTVAVDGQVIGLAAAQALRSGLDKAGVVLRTDTDLLAGVWPERPALPRGAVYAHRAPQAAVTRAAKLASVREAMARHGATQHFVSTVDDVAWITNLRGADGRLQPGLYSRTC